MFFCAPSDLDLKRFKKDWRADRQTAYVLEARIARLSKAQIVSCQMHVIEWVLEIFGLSRLWVNTSKQIYVIYR